MSWLSKAVKKAARSKILRSAASAAAGVLLPAVATRGLSIAKSLGGKIIGNRHASHDSKSVKAAVAKLGSMVPPSVIDGAKNPTRPAVIEAWPKKRSSRRSTPRSAKPKRGRKASGAPKPSDYGNTGEYEAAKQAHKKRRRTSAKPKASPTGKATKSGSSGKKKAAPFSAGNSNAAAMKAASASWKKMTDAQKKAAGGWRGHVSKTLGGK